jgi:hypothetical protein
MTLLLFMASLAASAGLPPTGDCSDLCFSDLSAPVVYAYDRVSNEGLIVQNFGNHSVNTSYRIDATGAEPVLLQDIWSVTERGVSQYWSMRKSPIYWSLE